MMDAVAATLAWATAAYLLALGLLLLVAPARGRHFLAGLAFALLAERAG